MKQYVCGICGYIHDEAVGGKWEDLPADWKCPVCKSSSGILRSACGKLLRINQQINKEFY